MRASGCRGGAEAQAARRSKASRAGGFIRRLPGLVPQPSAEPSGAGRQSKSPLPAGLADRLQAGPLAPRPALAAVGGYVERLSLSAFILRPPAVDVGGEVGQRYRRSFS